jgi:hypothetical protein
MARYNCERCGVVCHTTEAPHLCKDVAARLKRREQQADAVVKLMVAFGAHSDPVDRRLLADAIVKKLSEMGVTEDR